MNKRTYILVFLLLLAGFTSELSAQKKPKKAKQEISVVSAEVSAKQYDALLTWEGDPAAEWEITWKSAGIQRSETGAHVELLM